MLVQKIPDFIEKRVLEEYKELDLCWRHDDEVFSKLIAVLIPLSICIDLTPFEGRSAEIVRSRWRVNANDLLVFLISEL